MNVGSYSALDASVLVLNKTFMAIHVISVRRAFCLLCKDLAEVVSLEDGQFATYDFTSWAELSAFRAANFRQEEDDWVRTPTSEILSPRVIRLLSYDKMPKQTVKFNRRNIFARDHNQCQYCGKRFSTTELSLDHVIPRSQGGGTTWDNIVCACVDCNVRKGGRTPRGEHDADPQAGKAEAQPALEPQADAEEVPVVAVVHRQRLLERRTSGRRESRSEGHARRCTGGPFFPQSWNGRSEECSRATHS